MTDLRDLVGDDLTPEEEERLQRVHDLLVEAGPPPELPAAMTEWREPRRSLPSLPPRRAAAAVVLGAAAAAVAFGVGFLVGDRGPSPFPTMHVVAMRATSESPGALASVAIGKADEVGNWPLLLRVTRLPAQRPGAYYELWLTRGARRIASCGTFRVHDGTTTVRLNAPYRLKRFDGWVVTTGDPARVVLTT